LDGWGNRSPGSGLISVKSVIPIINPASVFGMTMLSTDELAELAGVSAATVRRYARSGDLPAVSSPGGHRKFDQREALAALEGLRERIRQMPASNDEFLSIVDPPATPRGQVVTVVASIRVVERAVVEPSWLDGAAWEALVEVADADY
jgi:excisionase family DNA binding protein